MTIHDWQEVTVTDVESTGGMHAVHAYFNACPESPDGRWVLYARSSAADAHTVDVCIQSRLDASVRVLDADVLCEDAHRVACQHWAGDNVVVWHRFTPDGVPSVYAAFPSSGAPGASGNPAPTAPRLLATNRLVGWGSPGQHLVPLYGPHWDADAPRDILMADLRTGATHVALSEADLRAACGDWLDATFGVDAPVSLFFPILSPDGRRMMTKIACPTGGDMRSPQASKRTGLLVWDLASRRLLWRGDDWGHPAWSADSQRIVNVQNLVIDAATGTSTHLDGVMNWAGSHPAWHPSGAFYATDVQTDRKLGDPKGWYGAALVQADGAAYRVLTRFDFNGGASSWRIPHPHPVFSADGRRLYLNINRGPWTRLHVIEPA